MKLPDFFGLDIGTHTIKIAEVKYSGSKPILENIGNIDSPFGATDASTPESIQILANKIKELKDAAGIKTNKFVAALPETVIFSRVLELPKSDEGKLEETIYWEAKQYIPIPVEDVQLDWIQIQEKKVNGNNIEQILLVAAPKKIVKIYQDIAQVAGLELLALETESVASSRIISHKSSFQSPVLILDFGANGTDMSVIKSDKLIFAQSLGTGSDALTKAIINDYGIPEQQAEQYKRTYGLMENAGEGKIARSLIPVMEIVINEINKTVNYFKAHLNEATPQQIFIVGDGSKLPGLANFMSARLGIQTQVFDPSSKVEMNKELKKQSEQLAFVGFVVSIGLAMKTE